MRRRFLSLQAPIERVTGFDIPVPLMKSEHYYLPNRQTNCDGGEEGDEFLNGTMESWNNGMTGLLRFARKDRFADLFNNIQNHFQIWMRLGWRAYGIRI